MPWGWPALSGAEQPCCKPATIATSNRIQTMDNLLPMNSAFYLYLLMIIVLLSVLKVLRVLSVLSCANARGHRADLALSAKCKVLGAGTYLTGGLRG